MSNKTEPVRPGDKVHVLAEFAYQDELSWVSGKVARRGQTIEVTEALIEASKDRFGRSWLDLVDDPAGQVAVYGKEIIGRGPFPAGLVPTQPRTLDHREARLEAARAARELPKGPERDDALAKVEKLYGPAEPTSRTNAVYSR
jgi:hypothetical protein